VIAAVEFNCMTVMQGDHSSAIHFTMLYQCHLVNGKAESIFGRKRGSILRGSYPLRTGV